jgi:hypothetical protein
MTHLALTLVGLFALYMWGVIFWALRWWLLGIAVWIAVGGFLATQHILAWNDYIGLSILLPFGLVMVVGLGAWAWDAIQWLRGTNKRAPAATRSTVEPTMMEALRARGPLHRLDPLFVGRRVFHNRFGIGTIVYISGNELTVDFDRAGEKLVFNSSVERDAPAT